MLANKVIKIGVESTCYGIAVALMIDGQRALAFPEQIDTTDRDEIDNYHPTLCWPMGVPLTKIREFPPGPMLPGWDILGAYKGRIGEDPWAEHGIVSLSKKNKEQTNSALDIRPPSPVILEENTRTAFEFAKRAVTKLSPPSWVARLIYSPNRHRHDKILMGEQGKTSRK